MKGGPTFTVIFLVDPSFDGIFFQFLGSSRKIDEYLSFSVYALEDSMMQKRTTLFIDKVRDWLLESLQNIVEKQIVLTF